MHPDENLAPPPPAPPPPDPGTAGSARPAGASAGAAAARARVNFAEMFRIAGPLLVVYLASVGLQFADTLMIKDLGTEELAAIQPAALMLWFVVCIGQGLLTSVNTFVSQCLGRGEPERCGHYGFQGLVFAGLFGGAALGLWFAAPGLFGLFGHEPEVQRLEVEYFRYSLPAVACYLVIFTCTNFFTAVHRNRPLMVGAVGATLLNVFFNWVFIWGNLGAPALGLGGAAVGSVLAAFCQAVYLLAVYLGPELRTRYATHRGALDWRAMGQMVRVGAPAGFHMAFDLGTWGLTMNWLVGIFGTAHLAANTVAVRWVHVAFMPPLALGMAVTALVGKAIGERNFPLAEATARAALGLTLAYMGLLSALYAVAGGPMVALLSNDPEVIRLGTMILWCAAAFQLFDGMHIVYIHALRGAGDNQWPAVAIIIQALLLQVGGGFLLTVYAPELGAVGPWFATTLYIMVFGITLFLRWRSGVWRRVDIFA